MSRGLDRAAVGSGVDPWKLSLQIPYFTSRLNFIDRFRGAKTTRAKSWLVCADDMLNALHSVEFQYREAIATCDPFSVNERDHP